ncbi:hypothetical protein NliqN6_4453 [Naganishia liquefaciens]|uniref:Nif3-like dinuclear metal center hexameric protein n=1 Tax=Naganishia liquefaciens TaxID=104408 RepID=A0A8H3TV03_9TREE|nr:hypothetical protein NliqN6_4453 [Naganishia liquefaciens]
MSLATASASATRTPIQLLQAAWKRIAPLELADTTWDNVGVMIEAPFPKKDARTVLLTIDLTIDVCKEALALPNCSLVVSYHPPIFSGLKSITLDNPLQGSLLKLAARGISVFSPHTSLDSIEGGINTWLASPFSDAASSMTPIQPKFPNPSTAPAHLAQHASAGMGRIVTFQDNKAMSLDEIVEKVKHHLGLQHVQLARPAASSTAPERITSLAICAGSGGSLFKRVSADCYLTGEMSHHETLAMTQQGKSIIACNHSNTERPYLAGVLREWLEREMTEEDGQGEGWEVVVSEMDRDPLEVV